MGKAKKKASRTGQSPGKADAEPRRLALAVDVVVLTARDGELRVLLIRRGPRHDAGEWALPGGFVGADESLEAAAERQLRTPAGLALDPTHREQMHTYDAPGRGDRAGDRVVSVAYLAVQPDPPEPGAGAAAATARWEPVDAVLNDTTPLAFGHADIVRDAVERVRHEIEHTALATAFLSGAFTEAQLRAVYEAVWGAGRDAKPFRLDAPNFHRSLTTLSPPIVELVPDAQAATGGRPAAMYRPSGHVLEGGPATRLERTIPHPKGATATRRLH